MLGPVQRLFGLRQKHNVFSAVLVLGQPLLVLRWQAAVLHATLGSTLLLTRFRVQMVMVELGRL